MSLDRGIAYATASLIILLTLASGPLVGFVTIPEPGTSSPPGTGNATVSVTSAPETVALDRGQHGAGLYYLEVPDTTIEISELQGNPILDYSIGIEELGYRRGSVVFLESVGNGTKSVQLERANFEQSRINQDQYEGQLQLTLRGDTETVLLNRTVTVEVTG